ncbi:MAG: YjbQ family protein [Chitinispirillaceae bacterium]|nr:YjbQ family protein [Chitinispirillaceae bacterium]
MFYYSEVLFKSLKRTHWVDITSDVQQSIQQSAIENGLCTISSLHTTGSVTLNENADPDVEADFFKKLNELIPQEKYFRHSEGNSDSHLKTSLVGLSVQLPVRNGHLVLGTWQSVYFCEFDGPRNRKVSVTIIG